MEALGRVELPTNGLGNRCSIHLSYRAIRTYELLALIVHKIVHKTDSYWILAFGSASIPSRTSS